MHFLALLVVVVALMALIILLFSVRIIFHKSHKFPETSTGHNKEMKKRGISCPRHEEVKYWSKQRKASACATCYEHARE